MSDEDETGTARDGAHELPAAVRTELEAHLQQYLRDPAAAHLWDPVVIGVPGGPVATLLLGHTGRTSGRLRHAVLQYYEHDGQIAIVASKGGVADHPAWYRNLVRNPDCEVRVGARDFKARARTVTGAKRAEWWARITREQPVQIDYQARTSREIPVIVLATAGRGS